MLPLEHVALVDTQALNRLLGRILSKPPASRSKKDQALLELAQRLDGAMRRLRQIQQPQKETPSGNFPSR